MYNYQVPSIYYVHSFADPKLHFLGFPIRSLSAQVIIFTKWSHYLHQGVYLSGRRFPPICLFSHFLGVSWHCAIEHSVFVLALT